MLQKLITSIALIVMFAFAQTGAVLHEISHYADISTSQQQPDKAPHNGFCDKCVSYGELAHALNSSYLAFATSLGAFDVYVIQTQSHQTAGQHAYAARAPPTQLI
jgi:hypothetical protein